MARLFVIAYRKKAADRKICGFHAKQFAMHDARRQKHSRDRLSTSNHWRRRRDSNPRYRFKPICFLSREVPSTTRPRLHTENKNYIVSVKKSRIISFHADLVNASLLIQRDYFALSVYETMPACSVLRIISRFRDRMPCVTHVRPVPCISRRSAPKS